MTLKHILAMDTISTLKDKKSYERFQNLLDEVLGGKYLLFVSSRSVKMRGFSFLSLHAF